MKITFWRRRSGYRLLFSGRNESHQILGGLWSSSGISEEDRLNCARFPFDIDHIDFMLLTHAHIDHSGRIPKQRWTVIANRFI